ncbi:MAG TPA: dihydroorotate dehydrogenase-like protein [Myxococcota bacterium]|nr:dihydroorotate dehydrogenase-like protein [Myxococcota bacterium]HQK50457.1 dihydroorotate dehydrogenase-like protein [Myxococcota bacterium]
MDLKTNYLGIELRNPIVVGASPLVDDLDAVRRLEEARVGAIVMHSLFEEQLLQEQWTDHLDRELVAESFAEARSYLPEPAEYRLGPENYLEQVRKVKQAVTCPVIGSLNGITGKGWTDHARLIQQAGADALELNLYRVAGSPDESPEEVEAQALEVVRSVKAAVTIPVAVKISPFYTALGNFASRLAAAGADGIVLFNRFYQPDIDVERLEVEPSLRLSTPAELLLRLRWLALLFGRVPADLAVTGGVHDAVDVVKSLMAGARAVQVVSALLRRGPGEAATLIEGLTKWMADHDYESVTQMQGAMSLARVADPSAYERGNYLKILNSWRGIA